MTAPTPSSTLRTQISQYGVQQPNAYNPYAAGAKLYGPAGTGVPNSGPVSPAGAQGYNERDMMVRAQRNALLSQMKARQSGDTLSSANLGGPLR